MHAVWIVPLLGLCLTLHVAGGAAAQSGQSVACSAAASRRATVVSVDERLELSLDSGLRVRLAGIEPPHATPANPRLALDARDALSGWLSGREIEFRALSAAPDRWGRLEIEASQAAAGGEALLPVAEALVDAGWARARPELSARACIGSLLQRERAARRSQIGIWADPAYRVFSAADSAAFVGHDGETIIAEGAVSGVGETATRTYINFGPIRTVDFAVTIRKASLKLLLDSGLRPAGFSGQTLRVRGALDTRFGPQIEIVEPAAIEILQDLSIPPHSRPQAKRS